MIHFVSVTCLLDLKFWIFMSHQWLRRVGLELAEREGALTVSVHEDVLLSKNKGPRKWYFHSFKKVFLFPSLSPIPSPSFPFFISVPWKKLGSHACQPSTQQLSSMAGPYFHILLCSVIECALIARRPETFSFFYYKRYFPILTQFVGSFFIIFSFFLLFLRLAPHSLWSKEWASHLQWLQGTGITRVWATSLICMVLGIEPRTSCMLGNHSASWTTPRAR